MDGGEEKLEKCSGEFSGKYWELEWEAIHETEEMSNDDEESYEVHTYEFLKHRSSQLKNGPEEVSNFYL